MRYRELGSSGIEVSVLSFGAWQVGDIGYWGNSEQHDAEATVKAAIDAGINLFDTAEMYGAGESERVLGKCLHGQRDDVLISSKVSPEHCKPGEIRKACEASLGRLNTGVIDLYQIHWPFREHSFAEIWEELDKLRSEGKIRMIGLSNFGPRDMEEWLAVGRSVSNQLPYNLVSRAIEYEIIPACLRHKQGIVAYMPLMQGLLAGRWMSVADIPHNRRRTRHFACERPGTRHGEPGCEKAVFHTLDVLREVAGELDVSMSEVALAWLLKHEMVSSVLVGARDPKQVTRSAQAADLFLPDEVFGRLCQASDPVKEHLGKNADLWLGATDSRYR